MEQENGKEKAVELKSIFVEIYPDWQGARVAREFRYGDKKTKFTVGLPVPKTEDDAQAIYGVGLEFAIAKGWKQHSYDCDTNLGNKFEAELAKGTNPETLVGMVAETLEADLIYSEKEKKASETAELKAAKAELGMSLAEMIAFVKASKK